LKRKAIVLLAILLCCQTTPFSAGGPVVKSGGGDFWAVLAAPGLNDTVGLSVPSDRVILHAAMSVSTVAATGTPPEYPGNVSLQVNGRNVWAFQGTGYGRLGLQDLFASGNASATFSAGKCETYSAAIRLPRGAMVQKAEMELQSTPLKAWKQMMNMTGRADDDRLGRSVCFAGDLNGDGFDDMVAGAQQNDAGGSNAGQAYVFFGNSTLDSTADVTFTGTAGERLGVSCSGAGDVNGDGYDDVIVGAHMNSSLGTETGRACIYLGGLIMDNVADVVLVGASAGDQFGIDVSGGGDLNNDGYYDVIVGGHLNDACGTDAGRAYIYFGGAAMDNVPDLVLNGSFSEDRFGSSVSVAGDINGDGYDDVVAGASYNDSAATDAGAAYVYFGGKDMDAAPDVNLSGKAAVDRFGVQVSGAGDVNGDGYVDVIAGSLNDDTVATDAGAAYLYLGGPAMDSRADVTLLGTATTDRFGTTVSGIGDVNDDGFDDVIASSPDNDDAGKDFGKAYVFFGGLNMDTTCDGCFTGAAADDGYGNSGRGGDCNGDGVCDVIVGAPRFDGSGSNKGRAYIFSYNHPIVDPEISIMSRTVWKRAGFFSGANASGDFSAELNGCLEIMEANFTDSFNNSFLHILPIAKARNEGNITITNLTVEYSYTARSPDFGQAINGYLSGHECPKDADGNFTVPMEVRARSPGSIRLSGLCFTADMPPLLVKEVRTLEMDEDCINASILDLYAYFQDDHDPDKDLNFSIVCATNASLVRLWLDSNRYLSADASTGPANDNWTGTVEAMVGCADTRGQTATSNLFTILVRNVNDPPVITSRPNKTAEPGMPYHYNVTARDGDNDTIHFSLSAAPEGMTIDADKGNVYWFPLATGTPNVVVTADDGTASGQQAYSITVPNRPPVITSSPFLEANVGLPYVYNMTATDVNNDSLRFELSSGPAGMAVNSLAGVLTWTPAAGGKFDVIVRVSDGRDKATQNFSITAIQGNRAPQIKSAPGRNATVDVPYCYNLSATDADADPLTFSIESGPPNMTVDASRGSIAWTPSEAGDIQVAVKVSDGRGGEVKQEFTIKVAAASRPKVQITSPSGSTSLKGEVRFSGTVKKGTRELSGVQMRMDGGQWADIAHDYAWNTTVDTRTLKNGRHLFEFRAYDGKEYSDIASVEPEVSNQATAARKGGLPMLGDGLWILLAASIVALAVLRRCNRPIWRA